MLFRRRKIVLVGTGMVGMSFAFAALNQNVCDELTLIDIDRRAGRGGGNGSQPRLGFFRGEPEDHGR